MEIQKYSERLLKYTSAFPKYKLLPVSLGHGTVYQPRMYNNTVPKKLGNKTLSSRMPRHCPGVSPKEQDTS